MEQGFTGVPIGARTPGVYVLRNQGRVAYVGRTKNLLSRLYAHAQHLRGKPLQAGMPARPVAYDSVEVRPCRIDLLEAEFEASCKALGWAA